MQQHHNTNEVKRQMKWNQHLGLAPSPCTLDSTAAAAPERHDMAILKVRLEKGGAKLELKFCRHCSGCNPFIL